MVTPKDKSGSRTAVALCSAMLAAGCAGEVVEPGAPETEPPRGHARAELIFEEAFSETGRIQVFRDSNGHLGTGLIGGVHDDPATVSRHLSNSLAQMHLSLRPGVPVPHELFEYDKEIALAPATLTPQPERVVEQPKDLAAFADTVCHDFAVANGTMRFWRASYDYWNSWVWSGKNFPLCPACNDWSFFWNVENENAAEHTLAVARPTTGPSCEDPAIFPVDPYTWGYHHWWWGYCGGPAVLTTSTVATLGVTVHYFVANPPDAL